MSAIDVHARIDPQTKREAEAVLTPMGLSLADAFRMFLSRVAYEKALPFEPFVPNSETVAAMEEARAGGLKRFSTIEALMRDLDADD